jgi:arylsulfatase A-like enzyme
MSTEKPNIVIIYADDLGFGDVGCYGAKNIPTPNLDRLAAGGLKFNNAFAAAATCTPSRYALLTGTYPFRNEQAKILPGDAPLIIDKTETTLPAMLRRGGYTSAIVGKWHLGMGDGHINWNGEISGTPNDAGFDHSFIMAATNDRVPCVYVNNRHVENLDPADPLEVSYQQENPWPELPTGRDNPELLTMRFSHGHDFSIVNGVSRIGYMKGGRSALWNDETMGEVFCERAKTFVRQHKEKPFFLYYAMHQPHVPRIPNPRFVGTTPHGPRGDVIVEMDHYIGEFLDELKAQGLEEKTIVIFSSDNGPVIDDGYHDRADEQLADHQAAGQLRGGKYSLYDGGTRVPTILSWPGTVKPGESDTMLCHTDFYASFAALSGTQLEAGEGPDSLNLLDAWLGRSSVGRKELITEGIQANTLIHQDNWVYIPVSTGTKYNPTTGTDMGRLNIPQLYDLSTDIGQIRNLAAENPEKCQLLQAKMDEIKSKQAG